MSRSRPALLPGLAAVLVLSAVPAPADAQGFLKRVQKAAQQAAAEAATRKAEEGARAGTEKTVDAAADAAGRTASGLLPGQGATAAARGGAAAGSAPLGTPGAEDAAAWANYDFTPGARPLFVDDFAGDAVGDFPRRLRWEKGTHEVVAYRGARWVRSTSFGWYAIPLPEALPERFTLELDLIAPSGWGQELLFGPKARGDHQARVVIAPDKGGVYVGGDPSLTAPARPYYDGRVIPVRVQADGRHVKVYMGETRVANAPQLDLGRDRQIRIGVSADQRSPVYVGNVRVMAGGKALYDALSTEGRVATQGVLFATGRAEGRPESAPTLKEIAGLLAAHPELRLTVEGHTDAAGDAAANQALSQARAEAVRQALATGYGVDAARLEARGYGASRPAAPNATPEGRAANRRVELVRR